MAYDFHETFEFILPDVEEQLQSFSEAEFNKNHGLMIEVAAIHAGATANFNHYSEEQLAKSVNTWLEPYPKPIIMNHDPHSEAVGRVMGAKMDKEADGTPFTRLQVAILDPAAIAKVADGRYLTGSVGGKADEAVCSICNTNWAAPREGAGLPCRHQRGKVYNGKFAMMDMRNITFKEYSFVNMPADSHSSVRKVGVSEEVEESDGWVKPARFFALDMVQESIVEYTTQESREVLTDMRRKDALPLYMGLKGAFISAQVVHEEDLSIKDSANVDKADTTNVNDPNSIEENAMPKVDSEANTDEDILAVAEELSADLAAPADEEVIEAPAEEAEDKAEEADDTEAPAEESDAEKAEEGKPEDADEGERAAGQEKPHDKDVDPETSEGAPKSREDEEASDEDAPVEEADEDATEEKEANEEAELDAPEEDVEPQENDELAAKVAKLEEENAKLRKALHRNLVERVVDTKIALGIIAVEDRASEVEEHDARSAGSLADSLRDLAKMEPREATQAPKLTDLEMEDTSESVGKENNVTTMGEEEIEEEASVEEKFENLMFDVLMGKRHA